MSEEELAGVVGLGQRVLIRDQIVDPDCGRANRGRAPRLHLLLAVTPEEPRTAVDPTGDQVVEGQLDPPAAQLAGPGPASRRADEDGVDSVDASSSWVRWSHDWWVGNRPSGEHVTS